MAANSMERRPGAVQQPGEKAGGRYTVGFSFRLPARHVRFRRIPNFKGPPIQPKLDVRYRRELFAR
jgi:hypothetical protein